MTDIETPEKSWTFLPNKISIAQGELTVTGHFAFLTLTYIENPLEPTDGRRPHLDIHYLTDRTQPLTFTLPYWMLGGKAVDEVTAKDVLLMLQDVLSTTFKGIPEAPLELPLHKIPPSKRDKVKAAARRQQ